MRRTFAVLVVTLLAAVPLAAAATVSAKARTVGPGDLADGVPADALAIPRDWRAVEEDGSLVVRGSSAGEALLRVGGGVNVFAYRASAVDGTLVFFIDGVEASRHRGDLRGADLALDGGEHTLTWRAYPAGSAPTFELQLVGMQAIVPPAADAIVDRLAACFPLDLSAIVHHALPIAPESLAASWDGAPVAVTTSSFLIDHDVLTRVAIQVPADGVAIGEHTLALSISLGDEVLDLLDDIVTLTDGAAALVWPPEGWIYDRTPTLSIATLGCDVAGTTIRLWVDGEEVDEPTGGLTRSWRFDHPLAFRETHAYRFDVSFPSGVTRSFGATFTEGLDVLEYDLQDATVLYLSRGGQATFSAHADAHDLLSARGDGAIVGGFAFQKGPRVHVRAEYAPLEIACTKIDERTLCGPYGGGSPDYWTHAGAAAPAHLRSARSDITAPGAGQLAAAAWFSRASAEIPEVTISTEARAELLRAVAEATAAVAAH